VIDALPHDLSKTGRPAAQASMMQHPNAVPRHSLRPSGVHLLTRASRQAGASRRDARVSHSAPTLSSHQAAGSRSPPNGKCYPCSASSTEDELQMTANDALAVEDHQRLISSFTEQMRSGTATFCRESALARPSPIHRRHRRFPFTPHPAFLHRFRIDQDLPIGSVQMPPDRRAVASIHRLDDRRPIPALSRVISTPETLQLPCTEVPVWVDPYPR
jgi:hypothetical protein